jgi:MoxR-like ATPase
LPADIIGTQIYNPRTAEFTVRKGPIFANLILADEINRAPAKVQSALLEAMQEKQVTIGERSYPLDRPFFVLATQNPIEHEGTYPLPEAQVDRFMLKVKLSYPSKDEELAILDRMAAIEPDVSVAPVVTLDDLLAMHRAIDELYMDDKIKRYIVDIISATRQPQDHGLDIGPYIQHGSSPRGSIFLARAARAHAFLEARDYVTPHDVKSVAPDVLRHRVVATYEADADETSADQLVKRILDAIRVP